MVFTPGALPTEQRGSRTSPVNHSAGNQSNSVKYNRRRDVFELFFEIAAFFLKSPLLHVNSLFFEGTRCAGLLFTI